MEENKKRAVYPGSFDPPTRGHMDIIERASRLFDELIVVILTNSEKKTFFTKEERKDILQELVKDYPNVRVAFYNGLLVDFVKKQKSRIIVKGLRAVTDFEYEMTMAQTNEILAPQLETIFMVSNKQYSFVSSSIVKEIARYGGDISQIAPRVSELALKKKLKSREVL